MQRILTGFFIMSRRKLNTEIFIEKSKSIHGNRFDYSLVEYKGSRTNVKIICDKGHVFEQLPTNHISKKSGCAQCSKVKLCTRDEFIEKAKLKHGNKYNYDKVVYVNSTIKVIIHCHEHGDFECTPNNHLNGKDCSICIGKRKNTAKFIKDAIEKHGNKYDYLFVDYKNNYTKIKIKCNIHGVFEQTPNSHLNGSGCNKCSQIIRNRKKRNNPTGWTSTNWQMSAKRSKHFDSFKVYVIRCWNDTEYFYKIGRTFTTTRHRFSGKYNMPYNYEIIEEIIFDNARDCFNKEWQLKRTHKEYKIIPKIHFKGRYECFSKINFDILN